MRTSIPIETADTVVLTIGAELVNALGRVTPGVSVQFVDLQHTSVRTLLSGEVDLMILPDGLINAPELSSVPLYPESFVCIARKDHPRIRHKLTPTLYEELPHIAYRADNRTDLTVETTIVGSEQRDVLRLPYFTLLPMLVQSTDAIALIQRGVARQFAKTTNIRILEPPFEIPEVTMCAYWAAIHEADPPHVWFRTLLQEVLRAGHGSSGRMNADNE